MTSVYTSLRRIAVALAIGAASTSVHAATITVNSQNNLGVPGTCVIRDAIQAANTNVAVNGCAAGQASPTVDVIQFGIAGSGVKTFIVGTSFPNITERVHINGYTQTGAVANSLASGSNATPMIVLNGSTATGTTAFTILPGGSNSTIRGLVIMNFPNGGILVDGASNVTIVGNFIGVDETGNLARGNGFNNYLGGVRLLADAVGEAVSNNIIGGTAPADKNVISTNSSNISIFAYSGGTGTNNQILGNLIGSNKAGTTRINQPLGTGRGIAIDGVSNTAIGSSVGTTPGGACSGGCNLISGNYGGIEIKTISNGNVVQGNMIGPNAAGTAVLPPVSASNLLSGIILSTLDGTQLVIGGTTAGARNVISGNSQEGIDVQNFGHNTPIVIRGNYIGTNSAGTEAIPNGQSGVHIYNTIGATIGGTAAGAGNLISGNTYLGISLEGGAGTIVQGNFVGTQAGGLLPLGNGRDGIRISSAGFTVPDNNIIGATVTGGPGGNTIAFNGEGSAFSAAGVSISTGIGNRVSTNSIHSNSGDPFGLGIDNGGDGPTNNDACDVDLGPNDFLNYPINVNVLTLGGVTAVTGTMRGRPNTTYTLEFYHSPSPDETGFGEGRTYFGTTTVITGPTPNCTVNFNVTTPGPAPAGSAVAVLAIGPDGSTSEFTGPTDRIFLGRFDP